MSTLARAVRQMNFTSTTTPQVLGLGQKVAGIVGKPEAFALSRWGVALGLTVYWFVEPDFSRWKPEEEAPAPVAE